jgi:hypothetical protein
VKYWNRWLRRMVSYAAARCGVVSRLCICSLHAVVTVLLHARLNIQDDHHLLALLCLVGAAGPEVLVTHACQTQVHRLGFAHAHY